MPREVVLGVAKQQDQSERALDDAALRKLVTWASDAFGMRSREYRLAQRLREIWRKENGEN